MNCIFILDGAPLPGAVCDGTKCFALSAGTYEVLDEETNQLIFSVQLCKEHGAKLATGPSA